jgi:cell wall-associated NlpC family hydrolase
MSLYKKFPLACAACALLWAFAASASAQETRPRLSTTTTATDRNGATRLENEPTVISLGEDLEEEEEATPAPFGAGLRLRGLELSIMSAIEGRLGTPYRLGAEGPGRYDCSGFVWSVFREAGIDFERGSARHFWSRFEPVADVERYRFGTLVFFNHLGHVGIVADEHGFYHASTSRGVVYSPFNEYWTRRIVGFRRVPAGMLEAAAARGASAPAAPFNVAAR